MNSSGLPSEPPDACELAGLLLTLPSQQPSARTRTWRALKALGAVVLRDGLHVLPVGATHAAGSLGDGEADALAGRVEAVLEAIDEELRSWMVGYEQVRSVVHEPSLLEAVQRVLRSRVAPMTEDRILYKDIAALDGLLHGTALLEAAESVA